MPMPNKVFGPRYTDYGFVLNGHPGRFSVEQAVLAATATHLYAGVVLGKAALGAVTATPAAAVSGSGGVPGNGAIGAVTVDDLAPDGRWMVRILNPAANAGAFEVIRPDGTIDGNGNVAVAYNGGINFTLADGATDFVEDDRIPVDVAYAAGTGRYAPLNLAAVNGGQTADAILLIQRGISTNPQRCAILARQQEVNGNLLIWPAGITSDQRKAAEAQLANKGILVRY